MKYFGIFYQYEGNTRVEVAGDRGVIRLDARKSIANMRLDCEEWARRYKFDAYTIERGTSLLNLFCVTLPALVTHKEQADG